MSDWIGSFSAGDVRLPATFHGTARLLDGAEIPVPPRPARHDDLPGRFEAELDISFALLAGLGFRPVDPSHPAWPLYLAASAAHAQAPPAAPPPAIDRHAPDAVLVPFETTVIVTEEMALRHGLVAPDRAASDGGAASPVQRVRPRPVPPPYRKDAGPNAGARGPLAPIAAFDAFLDFMGDPERHPMRTTGDAGDSDSRRQVPAGRDRLGDDRISTRAPDDSAL